MISDQDDFKIQTSPSRETERTNREDASSAGAPRNSICPGQPRLSFRGLPRPNPTRRVPRSRFAGTARRPQPWLGRLRAQLRVGEETGAPNSLCRRPGLSKVAGSSASGFRFDSEEAEAMRGLTLPFTGFSLKESLFPCIQ